MVQMQYEGNRQSLVYRVKQALSMWCLLTLNSLNTSATSHSSREFEKKRNPTKGDYARKRASDSKHFPAVILNIFFSEYSLI